ncbi:MAG: hypothetical protein JEZ08_09570 [Clostridiales bacterium]|nr:hypothetical protein [Clostridiales bacterium]
MEIIYENHHGVIIIFEDNITSYDEISPYLYDNDFEQMTMSNFNINLHLLQIIVTRGLCGEIELYPTDQNTISWHITLQTNNLEQALGYISDSNI